jgi:hypothetical protein
MGRVARNLGVLYLVLFLTWVVVLEHVLREPHFSIPSGVVARWIATPLVCLVISHCLGCRRWFWAASIPLVYWLCLLFTGYVSIPVCGNQ